MSVLNALMRKDQIIAFGSHRKSISILLLLTFISAVGTLAATMGPMFSSLRDAITLKLVYGTDFSHRFRDWFSFGGLAHYYMQYVVILMLVPVTCIHFKDQLNEKGCDISEQYLPSQPVSVWIISASRFLVRMRMMIILTLCTGIATYLTLGLFWEQITSLSVNWWLAFNSWLIVSIYVISWLLVLSSLSFLMSMLHCKKAKFSSILSVLLICACTLVVIFFAFGIFYQDLFGFVKWFPAPTDAFYRNTIVLNHQTWDTYTIPYNFLQTMWLSLFTWTNLLKLFFIGIVFIIATQKYLKMRV